MMLYVSSACVKHQRIRDSIVELAQGGLTNIELSGGTKYYPEYEQDLLVLKKEYGLNYLVHNYFPQPQIDFIFNLASPEEDIYLKSLAHAKAAIALCRKVGSQKFGFHAGFYMDFSVDQIGKSIALGTINDRAQALDRFCQGFKELKEAAQGVELYIENNVVSSTNLKNFNGQNPFMLCDHQGYMELKKRLDFKLLLDVAHLYVTCQSFGLNYERELKQLLPLTDYIHLSDNDGLHDQSRCFELNSPILNSLKGCDLASKTFTTETYGHLASIKSSQALVQDVLRLKI